MAFFFIGEWRGIAALIDERRLTRDGARLFLSRAMKDTGQFWHSVVLPRHFQRNAKRRYQYQQRKRKYSAIKKRLAEGEDVYIHGELLDEEVIEGGVVDIVRGGYTQSRSKTRPTIVAGPRTATIKFKVPRYISRRRRGSQPNMGRELKTLSTLDRVGMTDVMQHSFVRYVKAHGHLFVKKRIGSRTAA